MIMPMENNFWDSIKAYVGGAFLIAATWWFSRRKNNAETSKAAAEAKKITSEAKKIDYDELTICRQKMSEQFEQIQLLKKGDYEKQKEIERLTRKLNVYQTLEATIKNKT